MAQGILIWLISLVISYMIIAWVCSRNKLLDQSFLVKLFFFHSLLALTYYLYALSNPSDSRAYYLKVIRNFRGDSWGDFYGTSTTFIEFVGYPFIKFLGFNYEGIMSVFAFFGFVGFIFFYVFFKERIRLRHHILSLNLLVVIFLLPNLHFWSSSFGKGSLIFCGFGLFFYAINKPLPRVWALLLGGYIIYMIRPHIFFVILIGLTLGYTFSAKGASTALRVLVLMAGVALLIYIYDDIIKITGLEDESILDAGFSSRAERLTAATSGIDIANYNFAQKMFAFWFRPLFFDAPGILGMIVSFENLFYLLVFASLFHPKTIAFIIKADPITKACFITFMGVSIALAQISGNLGLAMRQKSQVMILMMFVILKFMDEQKIVNLQRIAYRKRVMQQREVLKGKQAPIR
jgi:hypothetical protein